MDDVVIVGGGLAGLCAARSLHEAGIAFQLYEAADEVGGRVRTDIIDGFILDRGFQVLLTAYPEAQRVLDYQALELQPFYPGALVRVGGRFHLVGDPMRKPMDLWATLRSPVGSLGDKARMGWLRYRLVHAKPETSLAGDDIPTMQALYGHGFSDEMVDRFFRPFLGGVFLDRTLETSSRMFRYVFQMFASGPVAVPRNGMGAIPLQVRASLPPDRVHLRSKVVQIHRSEIQLSSGHRLPAGRVVVATDMDAASQWLPDVPRRHWSGALCFYFDAPRPPVDQPILVLNGEAEGVINNLHVASQVNPGSAPSGRALVSVTVVGAGRGVAKTEGLVREELAEWFGEGVQDWRTLKTYVIPNALPAQPPGVLEPAQRSVRTASGVYLCGDHLDHGSIQGAMASGRRAAEAVLEDLAPQG